MGPTFYTLHGTLPHPLHTWCLPHPFGFGPRQGTHTPGPHPTPPRLLPVPNLDRHADSCLLVKFLFPLPFNTLPCLVRGLAKPHCGSLLRRYEQVGTVTVAAHRAFTARRDAVQDCHTAAPHCAHTHTTPAPHTTRTRTSPNDGSANLDKTLLASTPGHFCTHMHPTHVIAFRCPSPRTPTRRTRRPDCAPLPLPFAVPRGSQPTTPTAAPIGPHAF